MAVQTPSGAKIDAVGVARSLAPRFGERAARHDADDTFVAENYEDLRKAKLFSAAVPAELGGGGASHAEICEAIRIIARQCGSTGLAFSMHSHLLAALVWRHTHDAQPPAEPLLRRIAAEELVLVSSGGSDWLDSSGTLEKSDGGYTFTARKIFGSGSPGGHLLLTTGVYDDPASGPTVLHFGVNLKADGVKVLDNWRTLGMRGTGSNDITIEKVFVPEGGVSVRRPKGKWHKFFDVISPLVWPLVTSAYVGVAEAARDLAVEMARPKREDPAVQSLVGEMDTELHAARTMLAEMIRLAATDYAPTPETSSLTYMRKTILARAVTRTVSLAMEVAGGRSFYRSAPLERYFRDIQGVRFHPIQERKQQIFSGRIALGLDPV